MVMISNKQLADFISSAIDLIVNQAVDGVSAIAGSYVIISGHKKSQISITSVIAKSIIAKPKIIAILGLNRPQT